ncbi:MAG: PIN domain-containing protein [Prevotella sp.]|nr:PIN domain-containing protein [Prevotella sp.]
MKIFCDTNVLLEYIQQRKHVREVEQVLEFAVANNHELYISFGSFYTLTYLIERYLKEENLEKNVRLEKLRTILNGILDLFQFAVQDPQSIVDGVNDKLFSDLEDSYQAHTAISESCDLILTINVKHFRLIMEKGPIEVLSPQDFIQTFFQ